MKVHLLLVSLTALSTASAVQTGTLTPINPSRPTLITTISTSPAAAEARQVQGAPIKVINTKTVTISSAAPSLQPVQHLQPLQLAASATPVVAVASTADRPKRSGNIFQLFSQTKSGFGGGLGALTQISSSPLALGNAGASAGVGGGYSYGAPAAVGNGPTYSNYYSQPAVNTVPTSYTQKSFNFLGFKRSLLGVLLQAVKAITGGAIALKGQLLKAKGQLVSAKGQIISAGGDALASFGRNVASNALMPKANQAPAPSNSYGPPAPVYGVPAAPAPPTNPPISVSIVGHGPVPNYLPIPGPPAPTLITNHGSNGYRQQIAPSYGPPQHQTPIQRPQQSYGPPQQSYGPPQQSYGPPQQSYGPPQQLYNVPQSDHSDSISQNFIAPQSHGNFDGFGGSSGHSQGTTTFVETRYEPVQDIDVGSSYAPPSNSYLPVKRNVQKGVPVNSLNNFHAGLLVAKAAQATPAVAAAPAPAPSPVAQSPLASSHSSTSSAAPASNQAHQFGDRLFLSSLLGINKPKPPRPHPVTRALPPSVVAAASQQLAAQFALQHQQQQQQIQQQHFQQHLHRQHSDAVPSASMHRTAVAVSGPSGRFIVYGP